MFKFMKESNRMKHFWAGLIIGMLTTIIGSTLAGFYKEYKDKKSGTKFDWLDLLATVLGGLIGSIWPAIGYVIYKLDNSLLEGLTFTYSNLIFITFWIFVFDGKKVFRRYIKDLFGI